MGGAGQIHQINDHAQQDNKDQYADVPVHFVADDIEHGSYHGEAVKVSEKACTDNDTDQQGKVNFFGDQTDDDRQKRGDQRPECCIHVLFYSL